MHDNVVLVFTKPPVAGTVKTRLIPAIGEAAATGLYAFLLQRQVEWLCRESGFDVELWLTSGQDHPMIRQLAESHTLQCYLQRGEDLGERMGRAAREALSRYRRVLLLGVDCPALTPQHLHQAFAWLAAGEDAVMAPAEDGGYVLLGLRAWHQGLFHGHRWGEDSVAQSTRQALRSAGWCWRELPLLWDLDRPADLVRLDPALREGLLRAPLKTRIFS